MSIKYIKRGIQAEESAEDQAKTSQIVEGILSDVKKNGDEEIRKLSLKFDSWNPQSFKLSEQEIEDIVSKVSEKTKEDIKWAQAQVRRFAQIQKSALRDVEIETIPGVVLGHKNIPVNCAAVMCQGDGIQWWLLHI